MRPGGPPSGGRPSRATQGRGEEGAPALGGGARDYDDATRAGGARVPVTIRVLGGFAVEADGRTLVADPVPRRSAAALL